MSKKVFMERYRAEHPKTWGDLVYYVAANPLTSARRVWETVEPYNSAVTKAKGVMGHVGWTAPTVLGTAKYARETYAEWRNPTNTTESQVPNRTSANTSVLVQNQSRKAQLNESTASKQEL
jgi:hypothetical protein